MNRATPPQKTSLPYLDTKPQGAADFYFAINATFRFLLREKGREGWLRYLRELGMSYFKPVNEAWRAGGLPMVARYWRDFFAAEPGGEVEVRESVESVEIDVRRCPAIAHLRGHGREIVPSYCQHCFYLGEARAAAAGLAFRLEGGDGACLHRYTREGAALPPQDLSLIKGVSPC